MTEQETLQNDIAVLEAQISPKRNRLSEILAQEAADTEAKCRRAEQMEDAFTLDELRFSAHSRCACGAGHAYPLTTGVRGSWYCSDILLGRAKPQTDPDHKTHSKPLPFAFYEVKSEGQASPGGATTRPKE